MAFDISNMIDHQPLASSSTHPIFSLCYVSALWFGKSLMFFLLDQVHLIFVGSVHVWRIHMLIKSKTAFGQTTKVLNLTVLP